MRSLFLLLLTIVTAFSASAQRVIRTESINEEFLKYNAVIIENEVNYVFDIIGDSLSVVQHDQKKVLILSDNAMAFTNDYIFYNSFSRIENIEAYSLVPRPRGNRYNRLKVAHFKEAHDRDHSIFYNDTKTIRFAYPSVGKGVVTSLDFTTVYQNPRFLRQVYFQSFIPVASSKLVVKAHKDIKIGYKLFNMDGFDLTFKQYARGKYNYYEWEAKDVLPYRYVNSRFFGVRHHSPHISLYVDQVNINGNVQQYYSTVDDLYRFYLELMSDMESDASDEMVLLVDEITKGLSDRDKAKAILYWVQDNIRYVAYVDGYKGFVPASPLEVFSKRFGDCKGMSVLIHKMMELAGLPAWLSWVGTRNIPYTYQECPLPAVDNHMVVATTLGDTTFILDGTFRYIDFGMYPYNIQGKEVLIGIDEQECRIFEVPVSPASESMMYDSVAISLVGNSIKGKGKREHTGFNKMELAYAMAGVREADYNKRFSTLFGKGNNKFRVENYEVENVFEPDKSAIVHYEFQLDDYAIVMDDEIYVNLNLSRTYQNMKLDTARQFSPIINDFYFTEKHITKLEIPHGYEVSFMPPDDTILYDDFSISFTYIQADDYVLCEKVIVFEFLGVFEDKMPDWNAMIDRLGVNYRLSVVLSKKDNPHKK
ncbi:MAG: DUF3857 domain-containing protein [Bacteroidetes bacterium]|nr:MAG: DUF3857 domain-containing protein [Bacteroidota bacterium]